MPIQVQVQISRMQMLKRNTSHTVQMKRQIQNTDHQQGLCRTDSPAWWPCVGKTKPGMALALATRSDHELNYTVRRKLKSKPIAKHGNKQKRQSRSNTNSKCCTHKKEILTFRHGKNGQILLEPPNQWSTPLIYLSSANAQVSQSSNAQMLRYANAQVSQCSNVKHSNA